MCVAKTALRRRRQMQHDPRYSALARRASMKTKAEGGRDGKSKPGKKKA